MWDYAYQNEVIKGGMKWEIFILMILSLKNHRQHFILLLYEMRIIVTLILDAQKLKLLSKKITC